MTLFHESDGPERKIFGKLERSEAAARRKISLAVLNGWDALEVEAFELAGEKLWRVTGVPAMRNLEAMHGVRPGVSAPRSSNSKFRKDQRYRW